MHSRRLACFVLGVWLAGSLFLSWVATENLLAVDRIMAEPNPGAALEIKALGPGEARLLLRHEASEQNRWLFANWEIIQIVLGSVFFFFLLFGTHENKISLLLVLLMLILVLLQRFLLTPELTGLGRLTDFVPDVPSGGHNKFWVIQNAYTVAELCKLGLGLALTVRLIVRGRGRSSGDARDEFDLIDKADHRHVNRGLRPADRGHGAESLGG
jgi:hypothetical protein